MCGAVLIRLSKYAPLTGFFPLLFNFNDVCIVFNILVNMEFESVNKIAFILRDAENGTSSHSFNNISSSFA